MMDIRTFDELGKADFGWLQARHHFSFGRYVDRERMGFANLRVVNDDRVAAGTGFDAHPHDNMEIITYVRQGEIRHEDSLGNEGVTPAGSVQVMSAGSGITHAEFAGTKDNVVLYQIWILPDARNVTPRWDMAEFPTDPIVEALPLLVSGRDEDAGRGALMIHADAALYGGRMEAGHEIQQDFGRRAYVLVSQGRVLVQGQEMAAGDGAAVQDEGWLKIKALEEAEVVIIRLAE